MLKKIAELTMDKLPSPPKANASLKDLPTLLPSYGDG
jgi:hypothetical protein